MFIKIQGDDQNKLVKGNALTFAELQTTVDTILADKDSDCFADVFCSKTGYSEMPYSEGYAVYLIDLDEYTLALICQTVSGDENHQPVTVNSLSSRLGCSRQAVHRKMLSVIAAHPELSGFFRRVITKFAAAKSLTWRRKKDGGESCSATPRSSAKL